MIVGFKILSLNGYYQEAVDYISKVIFVPNPFDVATNIVNNYEVTNIFSTKITQADLDSLPFSTEAIVSVQGYFCYSTVDFDVEIIWRDYLGNIINKRLKPTEYFVVSYFVAIQLKWYKEKNYINILSTIPDGFDWSEKDFSNEDWLTPIL